MRRFSSCLPTCEWAPFSSRPRSFFVLASQFSCLRTCFSVLGVSVSVSGPRWPLLRLMLSNPHRFGSQRYTSAAEQRLTLPLERKSPFTQADRDTAHPELAL